MEDSGYLVAYDDVGGFEVGSKNGEYPDDFQSKMDPILQACEAENAGDVTVLFEQTTRNPENIDIRPGVVKCLRENGLVPKGYTVRDFDRDNEDFSFPFDEFDATGRSCLDDPFGLWAKRA